MASMVTPSRGTSSLTSSHPPKGDAKLQPLSSFTGDDQEDQRQQSQPVSSEDARVSDLGPKRRLNDLGGAYLCFCTEL